jgi:ABC-type uncharacterized transport system substrate-binding protein
MEYRVCYKDGGGWLIDKFTLKEDEALFHKKFLEAQGKQVQISVFDRLMEVQMDYDDYKKALAAQKEKSKETCQHKNVDTWFDEDSGDNTIICQDCDAVFYHEDYIQRLIKDGK